MEVILKKNNPAKKYNKFTLVCDKTISYSGSEIEKLGFKIINARIIKDIYYLQLENKNKKKEHISTVFGCTEIDHNQC